MKLKNDKTDNVKLRDKEEKKLKKQHSRHEPVYVERCYNFEYTLTLL